MVSVKFFKDAWLELKKVQTPSREETIKSTAGVFAMLIVFGLFLGVTDYVVGSLVRGLLNIE